MAAYSVHNNEELSIGNRIKYFRTQRGMNQTELAEKISVSSSVISNLENNKSMVGVHTLLDIIKVLDIGIEELFPEYSKLKDTDVEGFGEMVRLIAGFSEGDQSVVLRSLTQLFDAIKRSDLHSKNAKTDEKSDEIDQ